MLSNSQPNDSTAQPLLTIAVPTFNRAECLRDLLNVLRPQVASFPQVEVMISDNASEDATQDVVVSAIAEFAAAGARLVVFRHAVNVGADANFVSCFERASGKYFWMCGDDDVIVPGALAEVVPLLEETPEIDLVYATSYGFHEDFEAERQGDGMGRVRHTITDAKQFAMVVNIMFSFISGMIVNKQRLMSVEHEDPMAFLGTNLVQLAWTLPLLKHHRRSVVLWTRPVAARLGNAHGYSVGNVFGEKLAGNVSRILAGRKDLQGAILNFALRRWFPSVLIDLRAAGNDSLRLEEAHEKLQRAFGGNPRYWFFTWPALTWPFALAKVWTKGTALLSKGLYAVQLPGFWRKRT